MIYNIGDLKAKHEANKQLRQIIQNLLEDNKQLNDKNSELVNENLELIKEMNKLNAEIDWLRLALKIFLRGTE